MSEASNTSTSEIHHVVKDSDKEKCGFLYREFNVDGDRTSWKQLWFLLDKQTGILSCEKYQGTPVGSRFNIKQHGASMLIQGGGGSNETPFPFCFQIELPDAQCLHLCAATEVDFKSWVDSITSQIESSNADLASKAKIPLSSIIKSPSSRRLSRIVAKEPPKVQHSRWESLVPLFTARQGSIGYGLLFLLNPIALILRFGDWQVFSLLQLIANIYFIWLLWFFESPQEDLEDEHGGRSSAAIRQIPFANPNTESKSPEPCKAQVSGNIDGQKAKAGCSVEKCASAPALPVEGCWTTLDATRFKVRSGPNYRKTKLKKPSDVALLELVATDSNHKIDNVGSLVQLPEKENEKQDLLIINCQVPSYAPSNPLWGEKQGDGPGFNLIMYYWIPESLREVLDSKSDTNINSPATKLLRNLMSDQSSVRDRFKAIGIVANPEEQETLGRTERRLLDSYNGQPILTRPQHRFYKGPTYFEVDVDAHEFNYVARKGLTGVTEHMRHMIVDFGFVIEGQSDDELPEQIIGCVRLCKLDLKSAPQMS